MELVKPEPLIIGGRAHYTLTSYDPVSIVIEVSSTSEQDIELALQMTVTQMGGGPAELRNDAWVRENFEGLHNAAELREFVRQELIAMNAQMAEQQKIQRCAEALASRLMQSVPLDAVARTQQALAESFAYDLQEQGLTQAQFLAQSGMRESDLQAAFATKAKDITEQEAAIDAWAEHRKVQVTDEEVPEYVGMPADGNAEDLLSNLRASGQLEAAREFARRNKAMGIVISEASCTYHHETPAEAQARSLQARRIMEEEMRAEKKRQEESSRPHLKLV